MRLLGRTVIDGGWFKWGMTASGFECNVHLNGTLTVRASVTGLSGTFGVILDDDFKGMQVYRVGETPEDVVIADLKGPHKIRIVKLNEYIKNTLIFERITIDGDFLEPPEAKSLKLEFYGDSLTCGYGNLSPNREPPKDFCAEENGYLTYPSFLAQALDADFSVAAASGFGILTNCAGDPKDIIDAYWNMALPLEQVKWDFTKYTPDLVFINMGTNDMNWARTTNTPIDYDAFYKKLCWFADQIFARYPNCKLIATIGHDQSNAHYPTVKKAYTALTEQYKNVYLIADLTSNQEGGDWHPSVADHRMIFEQLLDQLTENHLVTAN